MLPRMACSGRLEIECSISDDAAGTAACGTGVPHYSRLATPTTKTCRWGPRSGDRRYTAATGAIQNEFGALQTASVTSEVSPKTTNASKVMVRRLTRRAGRATLAIPDLVRDSNTRISKAARKLDLGLPRVVWLPTQTTICLEAPCRGARRRSWPSKRPALVHAVLIADNLITNTPAAALRDRCRTTLTRPGGRRTL
jgi:hypothetical protein